MTLNIGDKYDLEVIDLCCNASGYDYLFTTGPDGKTHNVYNILKCQYSDIPEKIHGIVTGIDIFGKVKFKQDECRALQEHYELGRLYSFKISDCKKDKNDRQYYVLEDDFSYQRWYSDSDYLINDDIILEAKGITNSGYIFYDQYQHISIPETTDSQTASSIKTGTSCSHIFDGGDENEIIEYKTSIVFLPGNNEANIDKQLFNIIREISAFMNAKGGTLFIGIHDKTHKVVGIDKDLPHLCEGVSPYASSYSADYDHYELKIRDTLVSLCSTYAGSLIKFDFPKKDNTTYCKIEIEAANRPIWMKGNMLFQRQGNQTQMLRGEDLTLFVGERVGSYIISKAGNISSEKMSNNDMSAIIHDAVKSAINDRRVNLAAHISIPNAVEIKYWVVWFNDGTWLRQKDSSTEPNIFKQIPVTEDTGDILVAFCYSSGTLNTVKMSNFKRGANLGRICRDGMSIKEKPKEIFICHPADLIAIHSADTGGTEYVKLHHITDVNPTGNGKNQGSYIIPRNQGHVLNFKLISPIHADNIRAITAQKRETCHTFGFPLDGIDIKKEVDYLSKL